jgi:hypothetical protein
MKLQLNPQQEYWFKIVDKEKDVYKTLFHGINGSRILKIKEWLKADRKLVKDGTSKTIYESGWHIAPSLKECQDYLKYFKHIKKKAIVKCEAKVIWPKAHSRHNIFLAEWLKIIREMNL